MILSASVLPSTPPALGRNPTNFILTPVSRKPIFLKSAFDSGFVSSERTNGLRTPSEIRRRERAETASWARPRRRCCKGV